MRQDARHRCDFCGGNAVAFQRGASVCGRCGTDRTIGRSHAPVKPKRMALVGLFSSGLLIKMMLGSVAFAAVGSWAAAAVMAPTPATVPAFQTQTTVSEEAPAEVGYCSLLEDPAVTIDEIVSEANEQAALAHEMATDIKTWADCVSGAAIEHRGEAFNPKLACEHLEVRGPPFGLGESQRPDHAGKPDHGNDGNKDEAPGAENRLSNENRDRDDEKKPKDAADEDD